MIFFQTVGKLLTENSDALSIEISKKLDERYSSFLSESGLGNDVVVKWRAELIIHIGKAILAQDEAEVFDQVADWAVQTGEGAVRYGVAIDELMITVRMYRVVIWDYIESKLKIDNMTPSSILKVNRLIDALLDHTAHIFSVSYVNYSSKILKAAQKAFHDVSFPVVALSDNIAVLPLIGELNEERTSALIETILQKCTSLRIEQLILDLSGVPHIDTIAANQLFQLNQALNLIGISSTFTGIRPDLALPMVNLGVCFKHLIVKGTLKDALSANITGLNKYN